jgi:hypothetical protein
MKTNIGLNEKAAWMLRAQLETEEEEASQYQSLESQRSTL